MDTKDFRLVKLYDVLKKEYYLEWKDNHIVSIQLNNEDIPFVFIITEDNREEIIISVSLDFPDTFLLADLIIKCSKYCKLILGEAFYISNKGKILFGVDAMQQYQVDINFDFAEETAISKMSH